MRTLAITLMPLAFAAAASAAVAGPIAGRQEIGQEQAGSSVALTVGQQLAIHLPYVGGTGYTWVPGRNSAMLVTFLGSSLANTRQMPGAGAEQTLVFTASAAGSGVLELDYVRPWLKTAPPLKRFTVNLIIAPASE